MYESLSNPWAVFHIPHNPTMIMQNQHFVHGYGYPHRAPTWPAAQLPQKARKSTARRLPPILPLRLPSMLPRQRPSRLLPALTRDQKILEKWHSEWEAANVEDTLYKPRTFSSLTEPANIDLQTHSRQAPNVFLGHFDPQMEPEGRVAQRQRLQEETAKKLAKQEQTFASGNERVTKTRTGKQRSRVKETAKLRWFIDLTKEDDRLSDLAGQKMLVGDLENYYPVHTAQR